MAHLTCWPAPQLTTTTGRRLLQGRQLQNAVTENWTFTYIIITFSVVVGSIIMGIIALLLWYCWGGGKKSKVHPVSAHDSGGSEATGLEEEVGAAFETAR